MQPKPLIPPPYSLVVVAGIVAGVAGVVLVVTTRPSAPLADNLGIIAALLAWISSMVGTVLVFWKSQETHLSVNSRLDEMMRNAEAAAHAQGREDERQEEKDAK